jgi:hypothetical protein
MTAAERPCAPGPARRATRPPPVLGGFGKVSYRLLTGPAVRFRISPGYGISLMKAGWSRI